jgi:STE24 endopeptidase
VFVGGVERGGTVVGAGPLTRMYIAPAEIARAGHAAEAEAEVVATFAHELSHYVFHDTWLALWVAGVLILGTAAFTFALGRLAVGVSRGTLGFDSLRDPAAIPLVMMLAMAIWTFLASPVLMAVQRHIELRADKFAIELTRDNTAITRFYVREAAATPQRVQDFYWFFETFRATHPSNAERVRLAMTYKPWETGEQGVLSGICRGK